MSCRAGQGPAVVGGRSGVSDNQLPNLDVLSDFLPILMILDLSGESIQVFVPAFHQQGSTVELTFSFQPFQLLFTLYEIGYLTP